MNDRFFTPEVQYALEVASNAFAAAFAEALDMSLESTDELMTFHEFGRNFDFGEGRELQLVASHLTGFEDEDEDED